MSCNWSGGTVATGILLFHVKHCSSGRRSFASGKRRFHPCFCLPACCNCPVALSELATLMLMIQLCLNLKVLKHAIAAGKTYCKYNLLRKCGLLAHTSAAFLKNCCTEKLFICLRLGSRRQSCTLPPFCGKYGTPLQFVGNYGTINGKHHRTTPQRGGTA